MLQLQRQNNLGESRFVSETACCVVKSFVCDFVIVVGLLSAGGVSVFVSTPMAIFSRLLLLVSDSGLFIV